MDSAHGKRTRQKAPGARGGHDAPGCANRPSGLVLVNEGQAGAASVRAVLEAVTTALVAAGVPEDLRDRVELAVAEALNNATEHAYGGACGPVRVHVSRNPADGEILCTISDWGRPMPGGMLPEGRPPPLDTPLDELPEGGFGWLILRMLGNGFAYRRARGINRLRFGIVDESPAGEGEAAGATTSGRKGPP